MNPIEQATESANSHGVFRLFARFCVMKAFESIDIDELARVLHAWDVEGGPCDGPFEDLTDTQKDIWHSAALAVKNYLIGENQ